MCEKFQRIQRYSLLINTHSLKMHLIIAPVFTGLLVEVKTVKSSFNENKEVVLTLQDFSRQ